MATDDFPCQQVLPLRQSLGLTQTEFAEQLGVSQPLIAHWESGKRIPKGPSAILLRQLEKKAEKKSSRSY